MSNEHYFYELFLYSAKKRISCFEYMSIEMILQKHKNRIVGEKTEHNIVSISNSLKCL